MPRRTLKTAFVASVGLVIATYGAQAESGFEDLYGHWNWETDLKTCSFNGKAFIGENLDGAVSCEITAHQVCRSTEALVRQTCKLSRDGDLVRIDSSVAEYLDGFGSARENYQPDNFDLFVVSSSLMIGHLDSLSYAPSRWTRDASPTS